MGVVGERAWDIPPDGFAAAWNAAPDLDAAVEAIKGLVVGPVPRWAVRARAGELRAAGVMFKEFPTPPAGRAGEAA